MKIKKDWRFLEEQYGALFDVGVQKLGERQILRFTMDLVNETYTLKMGCWHSPFIF